MPKTTLRQTYLRKIALKARRHCRLVACAAGRRYLRTLRAIKQSILSRRFYKRPAYGPGMKTKRVHPRCDHLFFQQSEAKHKHDFRISTTEMDRLVAFFEGSVEFQSTGKKPQASPRYQLGVLVYRLAHGHDIRTIANHFGISSEHMSSCCLGCF